MVWDAKIISSRQNPAIVAACKLSDRKNREKENLFAFEGVKLFCEAIKHGIILEKVFIKRSACDKIIGKADSLYGGLATGSPLSYTLVEDTVFDKLCDENAPEGIFCVAQMPDALHRKVTNKAPADRKKESSMLLLESVRDPINVGAVCRSAVAFHIGRLVLSQDCADIYNPKTLRASMGTLFALPVDIVESMPDTILSLRRDGHRVFAAVLDASAEEVGKTPFCKGDCVVIGNEGHGLTEETVRACDGKRYIPMSDRAESLNAGVAASIFMWEMQKA